MKQQQPGSHQLRLNYNIIRHLESKTQIVWGLINKYCCKLCANWHQERRDRGQLGYNIMSVGDIAKIKCPKGAKISIASLQKIKEVEKEDTFCEVHILKNEEKIYALKIIHKGKIPPSEFQEEYRRMVNEINILYQINHPNIVKLCYHEQNNEDVLLLMEYAGLKLRGIIYKKLLQEEQIKNIARQILVGLKEIHDNGFVHRDLQPGNVLVSRQNEVRIIDFGYAHELNGRHTVIGSVPYMAPEITGDSFYNHKADIWSLGMITYEMFHQDIPFCSKKSFELDLFTQNVNKMKLDISPALSYESKDFITRMLALNPDQRPNAVQLLRHPFICDNQQEDTSFNFDAAPEKQYRKTHKIYQHKMALEKEKEASFLYQNLVGQKETELKRSIGEMFAHLHNQRDKMAEILKNYIELTTRELAQIDDERRH